MPPQGTELRRAALELKLAQARERLESARQADEAELRKSAEVALMILGRTAAEDEAEFMRRIK